MPSIIAGDFNVMRRGFLEGPFAAGSRNYVIGKTMLYSRQKLEKDYVEIYVPYQLEVHLKLEKLGYSVAYGRSDASPDMKTSRHGGCTDWIYSRGVSSKMDETVIFVNVGEREGASDHNAVICSFSLPLPTIPHPRMGSGPGVAGLLPHGAS